MDQPPKYHLIGKCPTIRHFLHTLEDGFIIRPSYMYIHLSYVLHNVIGQLQTSSLSVRDWGMDICTTTSRRKNLPIVSSWSEIEHYVCHCGVFYKIRGSYHCLFKPGFGPICKVMEYEDQRCLGLFLLELNRCREKLLKEKSTATQAYQQRTIIIFFDPMTHATSQLRNKQNIRGH